MNPRRPVMFACSARERKSATARFRRRRGVPCKSAQENIEFDVLTAMQWPSSCGRYQRIKLPSLGVGDETLERWGLNEGCCNVLPLLLVLLPCNRNHRRTGLRDSHVSIGVAVYVCRVTYIHRTTRIYASTFDAGLRDFVATTHGQALGKERGRGKFFRAPNASRRIDVCDCYNSLFWFCGCARD